MQFLMVLMALAACANAQSYGVPSLRSNSNGGYQDSGSEGQQGGQVKRYVSVHIAPEDGIQEEARVIRVPGGNKHVTIIFVKAPSGSSQQQTEVILPEQDEQKNIVYVLTKKASAEDGIKIRRPAAFRQTKPEVFFIRYKNQEQSQGQESGYSGPSSSTGTTSGATIGSGYGAPAF